MEIEIGIVLRIRAPSLDAAESAVEAALDGGDLQEAVNTYACDDGPVHVESAMQTYSRGPRQAMAAEIERAAGVIGEANVAAAVDDDPSGPLPDDDD